MKRSQQSVPSAETGAIAGDYKRRQSIQMPTKGGRNATTNAGQHASGGALGNPGRSVGKGNAQRRMPVQHPTANITGQKVPYGGQGQPPATRGGPAGLRAGGRNQNWPNGAMYTDSAKSGSSGKDAGPVATRKPKRRGKGAAFYGEY